LQRFLLTLQALCLLVTLPAHAQEIDEILVTAMRRAVAEDQLAIALTSLDGTEVKQHKLVTDALADTVGVQLQQTTPGQGAAIIRGLKGSAILHLVDGIRLNNAIFRSAPTQYLALVPVSSVERIEILRGTPASLYGSDAIGGVVQVVSRVPVFDSATPAIRGEVFLSADTAEQSRRLSATMDAGTKTLASSFSVELLDSGDRRVGGGEKIRPSAYTSRATRLLLAATPDDHRSYSLDLQYLEQPETPRTDELVPGFGQTEPSSSEFWFLPNRRSFVHGNYKSASGLLGVDWNVDAAWQRIDDDRLTRDFQAPVRTHETNRSDLYGLLISASKLTDRSSWIVGADYYYDEVLSSRVNEDVASGQTADVEPRFPNRSNIQQFSVFGNTTWSLNSHHAVTAGVRLSDIRTRLPATTAGPAAKINNSDVSGDLGWVFDFAENWQFTTEVGYGFRAPNVFDLGTLGNRPGNRFNIPNTQLDSEHVTHGDIGVSYRSTGVELALSAFAMRYRDRITSVLTGDVTPEGREITQSINAASSTVRGIEGSARIAFLRFWALTANLTYTWGEQTFDGLVFEPADRIPPLHGALRVEYDPVSSIKLEGWAEFADRQDRLSNRDIRDVRMDPNGTPGWASIGTRATWQPSAVWTWTATISNVADTRYRVHGSGIDAVGRNLAVAVRRIWQ